MGDLSLGPPAATGLSLTPRGDGIGGVMGASLGVRIAGVCLAGTLAITTALACEDHGGGRDDSSGGGTSESGGTVSGGTDGGTAAGTPTGQPPDNGSMSGSGGSEGPGGSGDSGGSGGGSGSGSSPATPSTPSTPGNPVGGVRIDAPAWLPPGPRSPNAGNTPDPESVYDTLRMTPSDCRDTLRSISAEAGWQVLHGLANACAAVQGQGGSWADAASDHAAAAGGLSTCKERAAYAVLGGILEFHRQHPSVTVPLPSSPPGKDACDFGIAAVNVVDRTEARPGDAVTIEVHDTYFDHRELRDNAAVLIDGEPLETGQVLVSGSGDRAVVCIAAPSLATGRYPKSVSVTVRYGDSATRENAFTLAAPDPEGSPGPPASACPEAPTGNSSASPAP
ncbi:hypothetical protein OG742_36355 [Streptomyces sp. NBC_00828]|uniref:hypothetical protein n=1 Tax=Streptomyces sp. NBC_00828 TaxID=2903678 RepID=UPI003866845C